MLVVVVLLAVIDVHSFMAHTATPHHVKMMMLRSQRSPFRPSGLLLRRAMSIRGGGGENAMIHGEGREHEECNEEGRRGEQAKGASGERLLRIHAQ
jgi:hypothetical protein